MTQKTARATLGVLTLGAALLTSVPLLAGSAAAAAPDCSTVAASYTQVDPGSSGAMTRNILISITPSVACTLATPGQVAIVDGQGDPLVVSQENTYTQSPVDIAAGQATPFLNVSWFNFLCGGSVAPFTAVFATSTATADIHPVSPAVVNPTCTSDSSGGLGIRLALTPIKGTAMSPSPVPSATTASVAPSSATRTSTPASSASTPSTSTSTSATATTTGSVEASSGTRTSAPAAALPYTGSSSIGPLLAAGEATILAGGVMALVLRKRRRA